MLNFSKKLLLIIAIFNSFLATAQKTYVFVGTYNGAKEKEGIFVYELNETTAVLEPITSYKGILNPAYLILSDNGKYVYACTNARVPGGGTVSSFEFNPTNKSLNFINSQSSGGDNPVYITAHKSGKWIINANYTGGSLAVHPLLENGVIGPESQVITFTDSSVNKERQEKSHVHQSIFSPQHDYIFFPDLGADKIRCYQFDITKEQPLQPPAVPFTKTIPGAGPRHMTFHPNRKYAYCIEEMMGMINVYTYAKGKLDSIQRISMHDGSVAEPYSGADIHISGDGKFLYASNRGTENNLAIYAIQKNGKLKSVGYQSTFGETPRNFSLSPNGKFLIVAHQTSGSIIVFERNAKTGLLKKTGTEIKVEGPSCVQIRQYE